MQVFVLNLEHARERRAAMQARLAAAGVAHEFLPAVDGRTLDARDPRIAGADPRLSPGELGCYLSHLAFWRAVVDRALPFAAVLEDDVLVEDRLPAVLAALAASPLPFDAVRLSALKPIVGIRIGELESGEALLLPTKNPSGAQGYAVSQQGARRLLDRLSRPLRPIDDALDAYWQYGLCIPLVSPPPVCEDDSMPSSIQGRFGDHRGRGPVAHLRRVLVAQRRRWQVGRLARRLGAGTSRG